LRVSVPVVPHACSAGGVVGASYWRVDVFQPCGIPPVWAAYRPVARSVVIMSGSSQGCIVTLDQPVALPPASAQQPPILYWRRGGSRRSVTTRIHGSRRRAQVLSPICELLLGLTEKVGSSSCRPRNMHSASASAARYSDSPAPLTCFHSVADGLARRSASGTPTACAPESAMRDCAGERPSGPLRPQWDRSPRLSGVRRGGDHGGVDAGRAKRRVI
jgi:hypothetical protein